MKKIAIVDYGMGNLHSVYKKVNKNDVIAEIVSSASSIAKYDKIILPGVGHFGKAIVLLKESGLFNAINEQVIIKEKPILGICLGMQLMCSTSEEGMAAGFGWFDSSVIKFRIKDKIRYKIPHMGWNNISIQKYSEIFKGINEDDEFYFVHSYHAHEGNPLDILATTIYEEKFISGLQKNNIFGLQFHPEKSHHCGEKIIKNFMNL